MKIASLALLFTLAGVLPSAAVCNTAALDGSWVVVTEDFPSGCLATVKAGRISGSCGNGTISLSASCGISGTISGASFVGRTEAVPSPSKAKPNLMMGAGGAIGGILAFRR